jgi:hypothetical protein
MIALARRTALPANTMIGFACRVGGAATRAVSRLNGGFRRCLAEMIGAAV